LIKILSLIKVISYIVYGKESVSTMKKFNKERETGIKLMKILNKDDPIFKDCKENFYSIVSHGDCFYSDDLETSISSKYWVNHGFKV
jgi:hypothetical protein